MSEPLQGLAFSDEQLLAVEKPAGLPSVPGRAEGLHDCMASRVAAHIADALVVHRLDMATSGLMLFARGKAMQRALSEAFAARQVHKRYIAVVDGCLADDVGEIELPLIADWPQRPRQKVDHVSGKPSLTRWQVLERDVERGRTRVQLEPVTGRSHQLRVHLMAIGHPILGDALYAAHDPPRAPRLLLHAQSLRFAHPVSGEPLQIESTVPF
jgi:tRNA pseudouridine32 synthase/23S rRNA pseudouridine746 synthase